MTRRERTRDFTRVRNLNNNKIGTVESHLSVQFTVDYDDGTFNYHFYSDENITWERAKEGE